MSENNNNINNNNKNNTFLEALNKKLREENKPLSKSLPEAYLQVQKYKEEINSLSSSPFESYKKLEEESVYIRERGSVVRGLNIRYFLKEGVQLACIIGVHLLRDTISGHGAVFFIEMYTQKLWFWTKNSFNALDEFGKADYLLQSTENDQYGFSNLDEFYKSDLFKKNPLLLCV